MNPIVIAALYGAVLGGLGGAIGYLIGSVVKKLFSLQRQPRWLPIVFAAIAVSASNSTRPTVIDWFERRNAPNTIDKALAQEPVYIAMKEYEPDLYVKVRAEIIRQVQAGANELTTM